MSEKTSKGQLDTESMGHLGPGEILCRARKEKGLAAEEVMLHLGITQRTLNALEKDEYDALPSPLYVKGYIRRYCSILDLSDTKILTDFDARVTELGVVNKEPSIRLDGDFNRRKINWTLIIPIITVLFFVILILWSFLSNTQDTETKELPLMNGGVSSLTETDYKETGTSEIDTKNISTVAMSTVEANNTETHFLELEPELAKVLKPSGPPLVVEGLQVLQIKVIKQSWVQILDAKGDILLADLKPSGYHSEVKGTAPFNVTLGYAPGVELTLNGQRVDIPVVSNNNTAKLKIGAKEEG